jgi:hypothetical protein
MDETGLDELSLAILQVLADAPDPAGISLPRLGKQLGQSASVLMRHLSLMSAASIGGRPGPGWVRVTQVDDRWTACLTDTVRQQCSVLFCARD